MRAAAAFATETGCCSVMQRRFRKTFRAGIHPCPGDPPAIPANDRFDSYVAFIVEVSTWRWTEDDGGARPQARCEMHQPTLVVEVNECVLKQFRCLRQCRLPNQVHVAFRQDFARFGADLDEQEFREKLSQMLHDLVEVHVALRCPLPTDDEARIEAIMYRHVATRPQVIPPQAGVAYAQLQTVASIRKLG